MRTTTTSALAFNASPAYTNPVPLNYRDPSGFAVSVQVTSTGDAVYKVEYTIGDIYALGASGVTWLTAPTSTGLDQVTNTTEIGAIAFPCTAVRLAVATANTSGSGTMTVIQNG